MYIQAKDPSSAYGPLYGALLTTRSALTEAEVPSLSNLENHLESLVKLTENVGRSGLSADDEQRLEEELDWSLLCLTEYAGLEEQRI